MSEESLWSLEGHTGLRDSLPNYNVYRVTVDEEGFPTHLVKLHAYGPSIELLSDGDTRLALEPSIPMVLDGGPH